MSISSAKVGGYAFSVHADVAQLVAHHLAKVRVASSNLVIRSDETGNPIGHLVVDNTTVAWPRGEAAACKAVYTGSNPVATSVAKLNSLYRRDWRSGSALP